MKVKWLVWMLVVWAGIGWVPAVVAEEGMIETVEELVVSSTVSMVEVEGGVLKRTVRLYPSRGEVQTLHQIDIDVSALFFSYSRHSLIEAWSDSLGLRQFKTTIEVNGNKSELSGERILHPVYGPTIEVKGNVEGETVNRLVPQMMFQFTSVDNYAYVGALSRVPVAYRVLNLFSGDVELTSIRPQGEIECPSPSKGTCLKTIMWNVKRRGAFYYDLDGLLRFADGEDEEGNFILSPKSSGQ